jgi:hypothetical protein
MYSRTHWLTAAYKMTRQIKLISSSDFVTEGTSLPSRCLVVKGGIHSTDVLLSNDRRSTYTDTQTLVRWMQCQVLMKTVSGNEKLMGGGGGRYTYTCMFDISLRLTTSRFISVHVHCVVMLMAWLRTKFHTPSSNGSLCTTMELNDT